MTRPNTPANDLPSLLAQAEWRSQFDAKTLHRARGYADKGNVVELTFEPLDLADPYNAGNNGDDEDIGTLSGSIAGTRHRAYECRVDIMISPSRDRLYLATDCDCPVGVGCKHAAAMLMEVERGQFDVIEGDLPPQIPTLSMPETRMDMGLWQQWLTSLDATPGSVAEPERQFGILLRRQGNDRLTVLPAWLRPSKSKGANKGALVDPQALQLSLRHDVVPMPAEGWPPDVAMDLVTLLHAALSPIGNQHWRSIQAHYEEQALERLLARYPVWYERGSQPLTRADPLTPELYWEKTDDAGQKLAMRLPVDDAVLMYGAGVWYVRPAHGCYGRVEGDRQLLQLLRYAPRLDPHQATLVHRQLADNGNTHALPLPVDYGEPVLVKDAPVGVLELRVQKAWHWKDGVCAVGVARAGFDYAHVRVHADRMSAVSHHFDGHRLHEIHRDYPREQQLLRKLGTLHLEPAQYTLSVRPGHPDDLGKDDLVLLHRGHPLAPEDWQPVIDKLESDGFRIEYAPDFPHDELVDIDDWYGELTPSGNAWFDVALGIEVDGACIDLLPIMRQLLADPTFPRVAPKREKKNATWRVKLDDTRSIELPLERLRTLIEPLLEWLESELDGEARVHRSRAAELDAMGIPWQGGDALRTQLERLEKARKPARKPRGFKGTLRPYQRDGLAWLDFLGAAGLGGILADDMGLGKTVQVLAHILAEKQRHKPEAPALVIAPTSLIGNWQAEAKRFAPTLKTLVIHGNDRADRYADIPAHDLVITTYPLLPRDSDKLVAARFSLLILDEAQAIKNAHSQAARIVRDIPATRRLAMTGTPLENHLGELWAEFDAVEPGLLGSERRFKHFYRTPIEKHGDAERQQHLNRRIGSLMLRRRKEDVLTDLPPKNDIVHTLELAGKQRELYETLRLAQHQRVQQAIRERGLAQSGIIVLDALLKLRQACCDPRLVKLDSARKVKQSAKLDALLELVDGLMTEGRRVLVFSQFTTMLELIAAALQKRKLAFETLTGQTPAKQRTAAVERFQRGDTPLFLISLKAGGTGLNLTAADTVIHYDPWWNPAVEAQATDRAHRIGQNKSVFVYRLICEGTVEEKIQAMQARKADLAKAVLEGGTSKKLRFDENDLDALFGSA
ncbi:MAG TPA: DEAD/DEAH box helicase [Oleiagrimonas sp.]|nr:DEAD/DEAH box helicase [Oleiagrimonas sp.]